MKIVCRLHAWDKPLTYIAKYLFYRKVVETLGKKNAIATLKECPSLFLLLSSLVLLCIVISYQNILVGTLISSLLLQCC